MGAGRIYTPAPINPACDLAQGLVGAWLNAPEIAGGTYAYDLSGRGFHATGVNAPGWLEGLPGGPPGGLAGFATTSTTGEYFDCGNSSTLNLTGGGWFAASVFFRNSTIGGGTTRWLIGRDDNTLGRAYALGAVNTDTVTLQINGAGKATSASNPIQTVPNRKWQRLCAVGSSAAGWRIYCDGVFLASGTWTAPASTTGPTTIGRRTFSGSEGKFNGSVSAALMSTWASPNAAASDAMAALDFDEWVRGYPTLFRRVNKTWVFGAADLTVRALESADDRLIESGDQRLLENGTVSSGVTAAAALTTSATLSADAAVTVTADAALTTSATLSATASSGTVADAALTTSATVSADASVLVTPSAALTTSATLAADASVLVTADASLTTSATLSATYETERLADAALTTSAALSADAAVLVTADAALTTSATLSATGTVTAATIGRRIGLKGHRTDTVSLTGRARHLVGLTGRPNHTVRLTGKDT